MAGFHRRKGRFQTSSHDWITASKAGVHLFRRTSLSSLVSHAIAREVRGARVMGPCLSHGSSPWAAGPRNDKDSSPINSDPDSGTKQAVKLQPLIEPPPVTLLLLQQISSKVARVGCSLRRPARDRRIGLAEPPASPVPPVLSGRDQAPPNSLIEQSLTRSQLLTPATVQRDCGNSGVVT
jgi:hypothetical protein